MRNLTILVAALVSFASNPAWAQETADTKARDFWDVYGGIGGSFEGRTGVEIELGAKFQPADWIEFGVSPANLVLYENENDLYEQETFGNGATVCRDLSNGQFTDEENCAPELSWRGNVTGEVNLSDEFSVGGGYLFGDQEAGFGSLRYNFSPSMALVGRVSESYTSAMLILRF